MAPTLGPVLLFAGAVLPIWKVLADTVIPEEDKKFKGDADAPKGKDHARVVRLKLDSGEPIIGLSLMTDDAPRVSFACEIAFICHASGFSLQSGTIDTHGEGASRLEFQLQISGVHCELTTWHVRHALLYMQLPASQHCLCCHHCCSKVLPIASLE